jgi:general secretion pathway protein C
VDTIISDKLASQLTSRPLLLAIIVVVLIACLADAYLTLKAPLPEQPQASKEMPSQSNENGLSYREMMAMNLFGAAAPAKQPQPSHQDIPETKLKLILKGAFTNSDPELASALVAKDRNAGAELFIVGDELPGNAVLEEVHPDYVVIKRGVQLEKLLFSRSQAEMERSKQETGFQPAAPSQPPAAPPEARTNAPAPAVSNSVPNTASPKSLYEIREQLRQQNNQ